MSLRKSAIFLQHPESKELGSRYDSWGGLEVLAGLLCFGLVVWASKLSFDNVEARSLGAYAVGIVGFMILAIVARHKARKAIEPVANDITKLAKALGYTNEYLTNTFTAVHLKQMGEERMVKLAKEGRMYSDFLNEIRDPNDLPLSPGLRHWADSRLWTKIEKGRSDLNELHQALCKFDLTSSHYDWVYKKIQEEPKA